MIIRFFSFVFHFALAVILLGLSIVAFASGNHNLQLDWLPWSGPTQTYWLLGLGLGGILVLVLALKGVLRVLFLAWTVAALIMLARGFFFSPYVFDGWSGFQTALLVVLAALLAAVGGWLQFRAAPARR